MRCIRERLTSFGFSSSFSVIEFIRTLNRSSFFCVISAWLPFIIPDMPGIISITLPSGPICAIASICSRISMSVNLPESIFFAVSSALSASITSSARSSSDCRSPIPSSREMKRSGSSFSSASSLSPVPTNITGALVSAIAESAPPPLAEPSSLVRITPLTPTASWKAAACGPACWPTVASSTSRISSGLITLATAFISEIRSLSSACRPAVSKICTSSSECAFSPAFAALTASLPPPATGTFTCSASCESWSYAAGR